MAAASPETLVAQMVDLLDVERIDRDLYRGRRKIGGVGRVYGGQAIAQALVAAMRSVEDGRVAHSLHAYFMRGGSEELPIILRVTRDFDGRSFATRRVIAQQDGVPILVLAASFQRPAEGYEHAAAMPDVPLPEALPTLREYASRLYTPGPDEPEPFWMRSSPIEMRICPIEPPGADGLPRQSVWLRTRTALGDETDLHRAVIAYMSDLALLSTSIRAHAPALGKPGLRAASLDHAVWLHEDARTDDWLLFACDSPWAGRARGFNRGQFFTRDGRLVASAAQEGMIRPPAR